MRNSGTRQTAVALDDLSTLLPDWSRHLRAMNRAPSTITSYGAVGLHFVAYLEERGMPTAASAVTREHVESYIADMVGTAAPATVAKHYRSLQQLLLAPCAFRAIRSRPSPPTRTCLDATLCGRRVCRRI